jgi:hypothetical protein
MRWEEAHTTSRGLLATRSLTLHPFRIADSVPQSTAEVESQRQATVEAIEAVAQCHQWPARPDAMTKGRKQVPALAALVDFWWQGVHQDVEAFVLPPRWQQGGDECRLPMVSGDQQVARTRCRRRKTQMQAAWEEVRAALDQHAITQGGAPPRAGGVERMGLAAGAGLSTDLLGRGRAQWGCVAHAPSPPGLAEA